MARSKRKIGQKKITIIVLILCFIISLLLTIFPKESPFSWKKIFEGMTSSSSPAIVTDSEDSIHFIDVGQGDCTLLVSGDNAALIDCGENGSGKGVTKYLKSLGIESLDFLIFSHHDSDHIGGADEILEKIPVKNIYTDLVPNPKDNESFNDVKRVCKSKGTEILIPKNLQEISLGSMVLKFYIPTPKDRDDENENGIVVMADVWGSQVLFTGDIGIKTEKMLIEEYPDLDCDILKVGHHGSKYSSDKDFLKTITPEYSVISVGADNSYGHPTTETLTRLSKVNSKIYRTDTLGTVVFEFDKNGAFAPAS